MHQEKVVEDVPIKEAGRDKSMETYNTVANTVAVEDPQVGRSEVLR